MIKESNEYDYIKNERAVYDLLSNQAKTIKKNKDRLYHYTTFESLLYIIQDRRFRLTRTDLLNDKAEKKIGNTEKASHNYVMSMTEGIEYISMWAMYGRPSGIKIRLDFSKEEFIRIINCNNDWSNYNSNVFHRFSVDENGNLIKDTLHKLFSLNNEPNPIRFAYIAYINKEKKKAKYNNKYFHSLILDEKSIEELTGFVKYDAWEFEKEIRLLVELKDNAREYIYLPISNDLIKTFRITFNPWISDKMSDMIKTQLNGLCGFDLKYKSSDNEGEIDETRL